MAEIVNLRRVRKQRARQDAEDQAQQNRVAFGRTKAERTLTEAEREKVARVLDGHRMKPDAP
jgi:regulator of protease activity HflC (stomatin/prohibitin superfamily)